MTQACNYTILVIPPYPKIFGMNVHLPVWSFFIDTSQFLDFVLYKEGSILIIVINVRSVKRRVSQYLNISGSFLFCIRKSGNFLASKD